MILKGRRWDKKREPHARIGLYTHRAHRPPSVDEQERMVRRFLSDHGLEWVLVAAFHDTTIGTEPLSRRPGLRGALRAATRGEIDILVTPDLTNLHRRMDHLSDLLRAVETASVAVVTGDGALNTSRPLGRLMVTMLGILTDQWRADEPHRTARGQPATRRRRIATSTEAC